jgi:hypothetical protein
MIGAPEHRSSSPIDHPQARQTQTPPLTSCGRADYGKECSATFRHVTDSPWLCSVAALLITWGRRASGKNPDRAINQTRWSHAASSRSRPTALVRNLCVSLCASLQVARRFEPGLLDHWSAVQFRWPWLHPRPDARAIWVRSSRFFYIGGLLRRPRRAPLPVHRRSYRDRRPRPGSVLPARFRIIDVTIDHQPRRAKHRRSDQIARDKGRRPAPRFLSRGARRVIAASSACLAFRSRNRVRPSC